MNMQGSVAHLADNDLIFIIVAIANSAFFAL